MQMGQTKSKNTYNIILFVVIEIPLDKFTINLPLDLPPFSRHGLPTGPTVPRQRASHGDQDLDAELLQSVEVLDEARVLEALEAGADAVPRWYILKKNNLLGDFHLNDGLLWDL